MGSMPLERIIERIRDDASREKESILNEARSKASQIEREAAREAEQIEASALARAREKASEILRRAETLADLDSRKAILSAKMKAVEEAFRRAADSLATLPDDQYRRLLVEVAAGVASGAERVIVSPRDRERLGSRFIQELNEALRARGKPGSVRFSDETRAMRGGVILAGERLEVNLTFDAALERVRDELVPRVAAILFPAGEE